MPYFNAKDGTELPHSDWGAGDPIVFAASQAFSSELWARSITFFVDHGFRCIALDRRGHGRSDTPGRGYDLDTLADDLGGLVERLDLDRTTLVGHSLGGAEMIRHIGRHGSKRIRRVLLFAPTGPFMTKTEDNPHGIERELFDQGRAAWIEDLPKWVADNTPAFLARPTSPEMARWLGGELLKTSLRVILECSHASFESDLRGDLRSFAVPTLFIHGDRDASVPLPFGRLAAELVRGSTLDIIEGAAHGAFLTDAPRVHDTMLAFINQRD